MTFTEPENPKMSKRAAILLGCGFACSLLGQIIRGREFWMVSNAFSLISSVFMVVAAVILWVHPRITYHFKDDNFDIFRWSVRERIPLTSISSVQVLERSDGSRGLELRHGGKPEFEYEGKTVQLWPRDFDAFRAQLEQNLERVRQLNAAATRGQSPTS